MRPRGSRGKRSRGRNRKLSSRPSKAENVTNPTERVKYKLPRQCWGPVITHALPNARCLAEWLVDALQPSSINQILSPPGAPEGWIEFITGSVLVAPTASIQGLPPLTQSSLSAVSRLQCIALPDELRVLVPAKTPLHLATRSHSPFPWPSSPYSGPDISWPDLIDASIDSLFSPESPSKDRTYSLLRLGVYSRNPHAPPPLPGTAVIWGNVVSSNSAVQRLKASPLWAFAASILGPALTVYLLWRCIVLEVREDKSWNQLAGRPLNSATAVLPPPTPHAQDPPVQRTSMFHCGSWFASPGLPPRSPLLVAASDGNPSSSPASSLAAHIFQSDLPPAKRLAASHDIENPPKVAQHAEPILESLLERVHHVPWNSLLAAHVPAPPNTLALGAYSPHGRVKSFTKAVINSIVPPRLWGGGKNRAIALEAISDAVVAPVRARPFRPESQVVLAKSMKTHARGTWLRGSVGARRAALASLIRWVTSVIAFPVTRTTFYATAAVASSSGRKVFFYRRPLWAASAAASLRASQRYTALSDQDLVERLRDKAWNGAAPLRWAPKGSGSGWRPIVNAGAARRPLASSNGFVPWNPNLPVADTYPSAQARQDNAVAAMRASSRAKSLAAVTGPPAPQGIGIRKGPQELAARLGKWMESQGKGKVLHVAATDIKGAYDTLPPKAVAEAAGYMGAAAPDKSWVVRWTELRAMARPTVDPDMSMTVVGRPRNRACADAELAAKGAVALARPPPGAVVVDKVYYPVVRGGPNLVQELTASVSAPIVRVPPGLRFFKQELGIPQGSVLSPAVCSTVLATGVDRFAGPLGARQQAEVDFSARIMDDYLFVTPSRTAGKLFVGGEWAKAVEGLSVHPDKTRSSWKHGSVPWCGYLFTSLAPEPGMWISRDWNRAGAAQSEPSALLVDARLVSSVNAAFNVWQASAAATWTRLGRSFGLSHEQRVDLARNTAERIIGEMSRALAAVPGSQPALPAKALSSVAFCGAASAGARRGVAPKAVRASENDYAVMLTFLTSEGVEAAGRGLWESLVD